ncbi:protein EIN4-like [Gastrolobium bilobum]|uniref:protein EIN4-like n=1 Tax=Gastrolobium bilobum TaxID=150636 RepID=UPI002AB23EE2|nr:protein EIN4-like [Gastrolobium bilobum]
METPFLWLLFSYLILCASATDVEYDNCNCDDGEGIWSIHSILVGQKVSDFFIAIAYFSIPIELLYFVSRSNVPFKLLFLQFVAFIVLCGLTHLLNAYSYHGPSSFQLLLSLTVAKFLTALVSCATALTLPPLIPLLLKIKVRELYLRQNVMELDQEVGIMKKQKEASWYVRMLTREIRKTLDKHTILYTTLVELSKTLDLHNCAVWMPNKDRGEMHLTHELKTNSAKFYRNSIPVNDPDVLEIRKTKGVRILRPESALGAASSGGGPGELGAVAAIRMPMLHVSNFKGGTPELVETCYAILVLVLPSSNSRVWTRHEMEIVEVVADQVAVALSHASVLEESQLMRQKLEEQNLALQQAKENAMMASQARKSFQKVMSHVMRRPMHSILGMLSLFQEENVRSEQKIIGDTMLKVGNVLSSLINDVMEISENDKGSFRLEMKPFLLHSMMREAACIVKCLCAYEAFGFEINVQKSLPELVIGNEARAFQVILHMVGSLLNMYDRGNLIFRVFLVSDGGDKDDKNFGIWRSSNQYEYVHIKFDFLITGKSQSDESTSTKHYTGRRQYYNNEPKEGLSFSMCKKLVRMMQGNIWILPNSLGMVQGMTLLLKFQIGPSLEKSIFAPKDSSNSEFRGLKVVLADDDGVNRTVTKKLLEKLGCEVTAVSSGFECLGAVSGSGNSFKIILLDLDMPEMDGFEVAMRIRKFQNYNWPLIIALIASAEEHVNEKCLHAGMNGLIRKPILLHEIADELRTFLQLKNSEYSFK